MNRNTPPAGKWPIQSAALVSDNHSLHMNMRELVRQYQWRMDDPPATADVALNYLENGTSTLFIVEDTPTLSAYESVRKIIDHPAGRLTPMLVLLRGHPNQDSTMFEKVFHVSTTLKPLTPNLFIPSFKRCIDLWATPLFAVLRGCAYSLQIGDTEAVVPKLKKLIEVPQAAPFAASALVQVYVQQNNWKEAESTIIEAIKMYPRAPSLMLTVAHFYAQGRMPAQAMRLYKKLKGVCNGSVLFSLDIAQSALAMGHLDIAIEALTEWTKARPGNEKVSNFLARLYMSEGLDLELDRLLQMNRSSIKKIQEHWERAENPQVSDQIAS